MKELIEYRLVLDPEGFEIVYAHGIILGIMSFRTRLHDKRSNGVPSSLPLIFDGTPIFMCYGPVVCRDGQAS